MSALTGALALSSCLTLAAGDQKQTQKTQQKRYTAVN